MAGSGRQRARRCSVRVLCGLFIVRCLLYQLSVIHVTFIIAVPSVFLKCYVLTFGIRDGRRHVVSTEISSTAECQELNLCDGLMRNFQNNCLTPCRRVLLVQAVKKFRTHPGTQGSLPCSQEPATCPYPKLQQSIPQPPILFHCSSWSFPSGFLHHHLSVFPVCSIRATCPAPLILRDLITRPVFVSSANHKASQCAVSFSLHRRSQFLPQHPVSELVILSLSLSNRQNKFCAL